MVNNKPVPQGDDAGLLSPEAIKAIFLTYYTRQYGEEAAKELLERLPDCNYAKAVAQAQLDLTRQERLDSEAIIRKLLKEIERLSKQNVASPVDIIAKARAELADLELRRLK